jgi:hypothetical protein
MIAMPISPEERAAAKKAYSEIRNCDASRAIVGLYLFLFFLFFLLFLASVAGGVSVFSDGKDLRGWAAGLSILSMFISGPFVFILLLFIGQLIGYLRLRPRYAENLKMVTELEQKYAGEFPYGLEQEVGVEYWNRRGEKRAILWRVDAFLSRKPVKK